MRNLNTLHSCFSSGSHYKRIYQFRDNFTSSNKTKPFETNFFLRRYCRCCFHLPRRLPVVIERNDGKPERHDSNRYKPLPGLGAAAVYQNRQCKPYHEARRQYLS